MNLSPIIRSRSLGAWNNSLPFKSALKVNTYRLIYIFLMWYGLTFLFYSTYKYQFLPHPTKNFQCIKRKILVSKYLLISQMAMVEFLVVGGVRWRKTPTLSAPLTNIGVQNNLSSVNVAQRVKFICRGRYIIFQYLKTWYLISVTIMYFIFIDTNFHLPLIE